MMVKSGLEFFIFKFTEPLQRYQANFFALGSSNPEGARLTSKQKILDHFSSSFVYKKVNFKTRDFSPLIERVLVGVSSVHLVVEF